MDKKLFVFDVDGTLYDLKYHRIPDSTIRAIKLLKKQGHYFAIATGRAHYGLGKALMDLKPDYVLAMNGAVVVDEHQNILSHHDFTMDDVNFVQKVAHELQAGLVWKFIDHYYIYQYAQKVDWLAGQLASDIGSEPFVYCDAQDRHFIDLPQCASIHASAKKIQDAFFKNESIDVARFSQEGFDVVLKGMNKGKGLKELMHTLNIQATDVIAFGDNYNDSEMMKVAGYSVAMGNAVTMIKESADYVSDSTDNDGIWKALKELHYI